MPTIRINKWIDDLNQLAKELPRLHKNLFYTLEKEAFFESIEKLKDNLKFYDDSMVQISISKIIAAVGDAHTTLIMSLSKLLPFEFYYFKEGIHIISTSPKYANFMHSKVLEINDICIEEIIEDFSSIVSHENPSFLKSQLAKYLKAVEILYGLEIIDTIHEVNFTLQSASGKIIEALVPSIPFSEFRNSVVTHSSYESSLPLYRMNSEKNYWSHYLKEYNTLYFKYNRCKDRLDVTVADFCSETMKFIHSENVDKLIIDLRNNQGGNSLLLDPFIGELSRCERLQKNGSIFVVIGRETFSSALLNAYSLKNLTNAIFVGEPSGGKPNCFGEVQYFQLQNSHLSIRYSTEYYQLIPDDTMESLFPDVRMDATLKDYVENIDPCVDYILDYLI